VGRRIDLAEFIKDVLDSVPDLTDDENEAIASRLVIANASRATDLQDLLLEAGDDG